MVDAQNQQLAETAAGLSSALTVRNVAVNKYHLIVSPPRSSSPCIRATPGRARGGSAERRAPQRSVGLERTRDGARRAGTAAAPDAPAAAAYVDARRAHATAAHRLRGRLPGHRRQGDRPHRRRRPACGHRPRPAGAHGRAAGPPRRRSSIATASQLAGRPGRQDRLRHAVHARRSEDGRQGARRGAQAQVAPASTAPSTIPRAALPTSTGRPTRPSPTRRPRSACRAWPATSKRSASTR